MLRLEGVVLFVAAIGLYVDAEFSILALVLLFLAPDLSVIGFAAGKRVGTLAYNAVHTSALPLALGAIGLVADAQVPVQIALIWLAHIGIDRALGFGLKYPSGFGDTHLQRV
ncbi:MAG: DUF4260 family protein [Solirubrobacterales bacterium]|nr:DUF4260 family protein [Solirubrobacterales bacterium]